MQKKILETERLLLQEFTINDVDFVFELVNSPKWIEFIGDKGIRTQEDAINYIKNNLIKSYEINGYGLWLVLLKQTNTPIGMCGLVNRDTLEDIDIGFAMLPEYIGAGYGFEIANATMNYAKHHLNLNKIVAITDVNNTASIKLVNKIGLQFEKTVKLSEDDSVLLFSPPSNKKDKEEIDLLSTSFFDLFTNANGAAPNLKNIKDLFISNGMIIKNTEGNPEIYNLEEFITPREKILNDGTLIDFKESEISHTTEIFQNIAHRFSLYKKSGKLNGVDFESKGVKTIQFIKVDNTWKITSVAWSDEN
ncbi:GNAT family N-acetyltransferase [Aquimarina sp. 2201CG5-10]|uniref:GNAT family N-acetyltransferase n=1 Tax=Aquimarina callyspongiae TaxID=3098150 RepID=UPI002AB4EE7C|nr:GNAT family N-acetyltransferase [Aquimarina sp. 2201CG5-10]MDY8138544.1 GNAT family N-acetyltransferase [Aquimarina sp. 2201CG5-10]